MFYKQTGLPLTATEMDLFAKLFVYEFVLFVTIFVITRLQLLSLVKWDLELISYLFWETHL